jgi:serine/threonine-protein kinase
MGVVWRVRHIQTNQLFALKTLRHAAPHNKQVLRRLLHEARATAAVQSRNVVRIVDVKPDYVHKGTDLPFIVMELLEGQSFADYLDANGPLEPPELLWVMRQVCHGLSLAHERGIVHRDLKPPNVFLAKDEEAGVVVKLCDFGIAKLQGNAIIDLAETGTLTTETGVLFGTPRYMAPEQLRRLGREGPATDQWALALIVFRALSGRSYFENARNLAELILAIVHEPLPAPSSLSPEVPEALDDWFFRSCARDPGDRFANVASQQAELELVLGAPAPRPVELQVPLQALATGSTPFDEGTKNSNRPVTIDESVRVRRKHILSATAYYALLGIATVIALLGTHWLGSSVRTRFGSATEVSRRPLLTSSAAEGAGASSTETPRFASNPPAIDASRSATSASSQPSLSYPAKVNSVRRKTPAPIRASVKPPGPANDLLPRGAPCTRSSQCREGLCAAEVCQ